MVWQKDEVPVVEASEINNALLSAQLSGVAEESLE